MLSLFGCSNTETSPVSSETNDNETSSEDFSDILGEPDPIVGEWELDESYNYDSIRKGFAPGSSVVFDEDFGGTHTCVFESDRESLEGTWTCTNESEISDLRFYMVNLEKSLFTGERMLRITLNDDEIDVISFKFEELYDEELTSNDLWEREVRYKRR